jgi:hypothetical protein
MKPGIILLLFVFCCGVPLQQAWSQKVMIQVGADGSLIIQPDKKPSPKLLPPASNNFVDLIMSQGKMIVLRSSGKKWTGKTPVIVTNRQKPPAISSSACPALTRTADSFSDIVSKHASQHGIDARLVQLVIKHESGFNSQAVSPKGARGLMQLMPGTATMLGVSDPFDAEQNIAGGIKYLKQCLERFNNDVALALAAYNAGPENVSRYQGVPPFAETRNYVTSIMRDYTGQTPSLPKTSPESSPVTSSPPPTAAAAGKKSGKPTHPLACLSPLYVGGSGKVNLTQVGKIKIITITEN